MYYDKSTKQVVGYEEAVEHYIIDPDGPKPEETRYGMWVESNGVLYPIYELHEKHTIDGCTLAIGHEEVIMVTPNGKVVYVYTR
jgi:hypothetical protein